MKWIYWPHDECPRCGDSVEIETGAPQDVRPDDVPDSMEGPWVYSGDKWRCTDGHEGVVYCDGETPVSLEGGDQ